MKNSVLAAYMKIINTLPLRVVLRMNLSDKWSTD